MFAQKDSGKCIDCGLCEKVCPQMHGGAVFHAPANCYAAWSLNAETRNSSASGGIATEIYRHMLAAGGKIVGAAFEPDFQVALRLGDSPSDLQSFQNSKYVYSDPGKVYSGIRRELKDGGAVAFVGLPCQVAGLLSFLRTTATPSEKLLAVDLVCHGTAPSSFLLDHLAVATRKTHRDATKICFRDPRMRTIKFHFTISDKNGVFYDKSVTDDDIYQIGYHQGIVYRENCYQCPYARSNRVGDLTLGDFHAGLGKYAPCSYERENVSCVLANTEKGQELLDVLQASRRIFLDRRPLEETLAHEPQLRHPTKPPPERAVFLREYAKSRNFEKSMRKAARKTIAANRAKNFFHYPLLMDLLRRNLPQPLLKAVREVLAFRRTRHAKN